MTGQSMAPLEGSGQSHFLRDHILLIFVFPVIYQDSPLPLASVWVLRKCYCSTSLPTFPATQGRVDTESQFCSF